MKNINFFLLLFTFTTALMMPQNVDSQIRISKSVFGNGGVVLADSSNQISGTAGQGLIGISGNSSIANKVGFWYQLEGIVTGVEQISNSLPKEFQLKQNYPNPFNPTTTIEFEVPKPVHVKLKLYDLLGREVVTLVDRKLQPGVYRQTFEATGLPSGIYFYHLQAEGFASTKKLMLLK